MSDENWWESGPVFSTTERTGTITAVPPGHTASGLRVGHFVAIALVAVVCGAAFTVALPGTIPPLAFGLGLSLNVLWWWIPLALLTVFGMIHAVQWLFGAMDGDFRQKSVALRACTTVIAAGLAGACLTWWWLLSISESAFGIDELLRTIMLCGAIGFAAVALIALLTVPPAARRAVRRAVRRVEAIVALREYGRRFPGEIVEIPDPKLWILGRPQFQITVRYGEPGSPRTLQVSNELAGHAGPDTWLARARLRRHGRFDARRGRPGPPTDLRQIHRAIPCTVVERGS